MRDAIRGLAFTSALTDDEIKGVGALLRQSDRLERENAELREWGERQVDRYTEARAENAKLKALLREALRYVTAYRIDHGMHSGGVADNAACECERRIEAALGEG